MSFLIDENMPPSLAELIKGLGFNARHVNEIGYNNTPDFKISEFAANSNEIIITHDTDFGTILALTGGNRPSVLLFRWKAISVQSVFAFLETHLPQLSENLTQGALVIVDDQKIRIRSLPLKI